MRVVRLLVTMFVLTGTFLVGAHANADAASCAPAAAGGDWPSYSGDLSNTRHQTLEDRIGPGSAYDIEKAFAFSSASTGGEAGLLGFSSTPVVADGCMFVAGSAGQIFAVNADTGELVWMSDPLGGGIYAVSVADGRVYANVSSQGGPSAAAVDQATGATLWQTVVDTDPAAYTSASAVAFDGLLFYGISGPEDGTGDAGPHPGGYAILDAGSGDMLVRRYVNSIDDQALGYYGTSVWGTAVIDEETKYAYVGTGQPANKGREHEHGNAMLKIDVDRSRATFGEIVDAYKGDVDSYVPGLANNKACEDNIGGLGGGIGGTCFGLDVDFGASPTLMTTSRGRKIVGNLQKSGTYHAVYADTMEQAWKTILSVPLALGNAGSSANDGKAIYVEATPGTLYSLNANTGGINWVAPIADGVDYHPPSVANGVVWIISDHTLLLGYDAATGALVGARSLALDAGDVCVPLGGGIAIARNKLYATCDIGVQGGGWVVAYGFDGELPLPPLP